MQTTGLTLEMGFATSGGAFALGRGMDDAPPAPTSQEPHRPLPIKTWAIKKCEEFQNKLKSVLSREEVRSCNGISVSAEGGKFAAVLVQGVGSSC